MGLLEARDVFERTYIARTLEELGSVSAAARELRLNRTDLHRRMRKFGIASPQAHCQSRGNSLWQELGA
jgi:transcriptional regulator with GAF, ATPase, and Fis domain